MPCNQQWSFSNLAGHSGIAIAILPALPVALKRFGLVFESCQPVEPNLKDFAPSTPKTPSQVMRTLGSLKFSEVQSLNSPLAHGPLASVVSSSCERQPSTADCCHRNTPRLKTSTIPMNFATAMTPSSIEVRSVWSVLCLSRHRTAAAF